MTAIAGCVQYNLQASLPTSVGRVFFTSKSRKNLTSIGQHTVLSFYNWPGELVIDTSLFQIRCTRASLHQLHAPQYTRISGVISSPSFRCSGLCISKILQCTNKQNDDLFTGHKLRYVPMLKDEACDGISSENKHAFLVEGLNWAEKSISCNLGFAAQNFPLPDYESY